MGISESEKVILDWLAQQYDAMVALLAETVSIDSGSYNKKGVDAVGRLFRDHLSKAGIACEVIPRADHLPFALDGGTHAFIRDAQGDDAFPTAGDCRESFICLLGSPCRPKRALASWRGIFELS